MYNLIRIIIVVVLLSPLLWWVIRNWKKKEKRNLVLAAGIGGVIIAFAIVTLIGPIENTFYRWKTPEEAFQYMYIDKTIIDTIEYGDEAYVYYHSAWEGKSSTGGQFLRKDNKGWMVSDPRVTDYQYKSIIIFSEGPTTIVSVERPFDSEISILTISTIEMENGNIGSIPDIIDSTGENFMTYKTEESGGVRRTVFIKPLKIEESYSLEIGQYKISSDYLMDFSINQQTIELDNL